MTPAYRAAQRLTAGHHRTIRAAARWAARNKLTAAAGAIIGAPALWQTIERDPRLLATLPPLWGWVCWRTPTAVTSDDSGGEGRDGGGGEGMSIKKPPVGNKINTAQGTCYSTDTNVPGYTRIEWETPWQTTAPATAYEETT